MLLQFLDCEPDLVVGPTDAQPCLIDCARSPHLLPIRAVPKSGSPNPVFVTWAEGKCFALHRCRPDLLQQLHQVFMEVSDGSTAVCCYDAMGLRVHHAHDMASTVLIAPAQLQAPCALLQLTCRQLAACSTVFDGTRLTLSVPEVAAADVYLAFPVHLLHSMGWDTRFSPFPHASEQQLHITLQPSSATPLLGVQTIRHWLRTVFFVGALRQQESQCRGPRRCTTEAVAVCASVMTCPCWKGCLPGSLTFGEVEATWELASYATQCHPRARVFSGPFPVPVQTSLRSCLEMQPHQRWVKGNPPALALTIMPSFHGGGAKDDKIQVAKAKVAQLCLEQGYSLPEVNKISAQLLNQVSLAKLSQALDACPVAEQWLQLRAIMQAHGIQEPTTSEVAARISQKVQTHARRKQLFASHLSAEHFALAGGFFVNQDQSPANILSKITPGSCGVILLDKAVAEEVIRNMTHRPHDELGLVILGHECPDAGSCCKKLRFPAVAIGAEGHVLLAGCLHNMGSRNIEVVVKDVAQVDLAEMVPCTLQSYQDEWGQDPTWQDVTQSPVKLMVEQFKLQGIVLPAVQPWGRSYRQGGKPSTPTLCDSVQFNAMIPKTSLTSVLKVSGHHGVYVVPRDDKGQILKGWSIIWLPGSKADIAKLALGVTEQIGLARAKDRFGLQSRGLRLRHCLPQASARPVPSCTCYRSAALQNQPAAHWHYRGLHHSVGLWPVLASAGPQVSGQASGLSDPKSHPRLDGLRSVAKRC